MRVSEVYLSIQGEGPNVGAPTVFVRFGGCNLRCALWPCDTPYAIDPAYRKEWLVETPESLFNRIEDARNGHKLVNVCFTGGEPFMQKSDDLARLYDKLYQAKSYLFIEAFSNGTLRYPDWVRHKNTIQVVMDWKLPGSGEYKVNDHIRRANVKALTDQVYDNLSVKFTIASREDYLTAARIYMNTIENLAHIPQVFAGVVWGKLTNEELVDWMLADGLWWRLNVQVHNHIWDRNKRGI